MCLAYSPGFLPLPARHERGGAGRTAVELRSADFSPPPLGTCKSAGSGMNSALQVRRNWLNSTAVLPDPPPARPSRREGDTRRIRYKSTRAGYSDGRGQSAESAFHFKPGITLVEFGPMPWRTQKCWTKPGGTD